MNANMQIDMFREEVLRAPVLGAYGAGVDSTAMLIEMISRGERVDQVLMADTRSEDPRTMDYAEMFAEWLRSHGIPFQMVLNEVMDFKRWPEYSGLYENCLTNGTLPSISFGFSACSAKHKIAPQDKWTKTWEPAQAAWAQGMKVTKLIGYDCSPSDVKRYAEREGHVNDLYGFRYPLREWGWKRTDCIARIEAEGLPVPRKSACFMCLATKPHELHEFNKTILRRIVLLEARAHPRLRNVEGLWRKTVKGMRGATARPGSMTVYIREQKLLPEREIDYIWNEVPKALLNWLDAQGTQPLALRQPIAEWIAFFDADGALFEGDGMPLLYEGRVPSMAAAA